MSRLLAAGCIVYDQVDLVLPSGSSNRSIGVTAASIASKLFVNNVLASWPVVDGTTVADAQVISGYIYFNEILGLPGYYSIRFYPSRTGFWRMILQAQGEEFVLEYDIVTAGFFSSSTPVGGLTASFSQ